MSARVKIKRYGFVNHGVRTIPMADIRDGLIVECEQDNPPSQKGRTVYLWLTEDDRDALLKVLKEEAIRARQ